MDILATLEQIVSNQIGVKVEDLKRDVPLNELGADSLDVVEIIVAIEEQFNFEVDDDEVKEATTINLLASYIAKKTQK